MAFDHYIILASQVIQSDNTLQKGPEFPVWTTCQKPVEYIKFPINFPIMEFKEKTFSSQTIPEFGIPIVENFMFANLKNIKVLNNRYSKFKNCLRTKSFFLDSIIGKFIRNIMYSTGF